MKIKELLKKKETKILILIFLFALGFRLFFVLQTPYFSSDTAYFELRNVEFITENFKPILFDELSYGGRFLLNPHFFHSLLSIFAFVFPVVWVLKFIPELLAALLVFVVFGLTKRITQNNTAAFLSAFMAGLSPIFLTQTLNQASVYCMIVLVFFFLLYAFFNLKKYLIYFIIGSFILPLINPMGFLFPLSLIIYYLLLNLDELRFQNLQKEAIIFSVLLIFFLNIIIFKQVFLEYGIYAVWQNVPMALLVDYFGEMTPLTVVKALGVLPLLFGLFGFGVGFWLKKKKTVYFMSALVLADFILMALRLINLNEGLLFLGLTLAIMSALSFDIITDYLRLTKFNTYKKTILYVIIGILLLGITVPAYNEASELIDNTIGDEYYDALVWILENTDEDVTVLADISDGHYITAIANRKNVADTFFLFAEDRYKELNEALTTESIVKMRQVLHKYDVTYIFLSEKTKALYNLDTVKYDTDVRCFDEVFKNDEATVYLFEC